jgi:hypothetical protein
MDVTGPLQVSFSVRRSNSPSKGNSRAESPFPAGTAGSVAFLLDSAADLEEIWSITDLAAGATIRR